MKKTEIRLAHIITGICLTAAIVILCFLIDGILGVFGESIGQGTIIEFKADSSGNNGFSREANVYTEYGTTNVTFSGDITTDGTAQISMISDDGIIVFSKTYMAADSGKIDIEVTGLMPQTYYILRFSSDDARTGHLFLTTNQALVERPEVPVRTANTIPYR